MSALRPPLAAADPRTLRSAPPSQAARLRVYSRRDPMWLLVPACLEPTRDAVRLYGPLAYAGSFAAERLSESELQDVTLQFDVSSYARIPAKTARRLLGHARCARLVRFFRGGDRFFCNGD